ncbi:hypothetical protein KFK09_015664 [Dendrobium nobile]|uniref:Uncharacterized protein n=1 Tax=Dendrobium nobile TaxID=94219 RepID=A0A8T3B6N2_DENNO|nr:hypothetical protein KFK09_015664 [Dendrobium nobile]
MRSSVEKTVISLLLPYTRSPYPNYSGLLQRRLFLLVQNPRLLHKPTETSQLQQAVDPFTKSYSTFSASSDFQSSTSLQLQYPFPFELLPLVEPTNPSIDASYRRLLALDRIQSRLNLRSQAPSDDFVGSEVVTELAR